MPNEGSGRGGFGGGGNYQKPHHSARPSRPGSRGGPLPARSYRYSPPARRTVPVRPAPQRRPLNRPAASRENRPNATKPAPQASAVNIRRALALAALLRNQLPVGQNVALSSLLANSRFGHGVANVEADQTWNKISGLFPKGAKQPKLAFDAPSEAYAYTDRKGVHLNPSRIRDLTPHSSLASVLYGDTESYPAPEADRRLAHEFAHSQQKNPKPGPASEGGAEAFSKVAFQALNPRAKPGDVNKAYKQMAVPHYQALARWYAKNYGMRNVMRGQFK